jgi:hypothetical protein
VRSTAQTRFNKHQNFKQSRKLKLGNQETGQIQLLKAKFVLKSEVEGMVVSEKRCSRQLRSGKM